MELPQIKAFIDAMASSDLTELEASKDGWTLRLVRRAGDVPPPGAGRRSAPGATIPARTRPSRRPRSPAPEMCAPLSGIVYLQSIARTQPPFVVVGQAVKAGTTLCVIEAMKIFNEIRAERDGIVEAMLVASESVVDAGQPLIRIT